MKRPQFHSFEVTFGASGAPGRGDADYDGLGAEFKMPKCQNSKMRKFKNAKIRKCKNSKMQKFENAKIRKFAKFNLAIKRLQFHSFEATFGASGAPGRGDADYDGLGAKFRKC